MASDDFPFFTGWRAPYTNIPPIEQSLLPASHPVNPVVLQPMGPTGCRLIPNAFEHFPHLIDRRLMPTPFGFDPLKRVFGGF